MDEHEIKAIAAQLRKPSGEIGKEIGERLITSNAVLYHHTLNALAASPGDQILEIGMGTGSHVGEILDSNVDIVYTGCDYSELMIEEAQNFNRAYIESGRARFLCADVCNLPLPSSAFTKAFTVNTMYFWDDVEKGLSELYRVLKKGGRLHIAGRPKHIMIDYPFSAHGFKMFDKEEISEIMQLQGFEINGIIEEKEEPRQMDGQLYKIETLIISGTKI